jgi:peptidoglycan L-alanyl-D-glutamate endopeptidase CwlK
MIDPRSQKNLDSLLPKVRPVFVQLLSHLQEHFASRGVVPRYISGNRTWEEQDAIFAQGRTKPGPIVTKARGGESRHNFGLALDIGLFKGKEYLTKSPLYKEIGQVVAKFPQIEWGGSWKSIVDEPHVEFRTGLSLAQMRERVRSGKSIV